MDPNLPMYKYCCQEIKSGNKFRTCQKCTELNYMCDAHKTKESCDAKPNYCTWEDNKCYNKRIPFAVDATDCKPAGQPPAVCADEYKPTFIEDKSNIIGLKWWVFLTAAILVFIICCLSGIFIFIHI